MAYFEKGGDGINAVYQADIDGAVIQIRVDPLMRTLVVGKPNSPVTLSSAHVTELIPLLQGYVDNGELP